jgi:hypothetical protein
MLSSPALNDARLATKPSQAELDTTILSDARRVEST